MPIHSPELKENINDCDNINYEAGFCSKSDEEYKELDGDVSYYKDEDVLNSFLTNKL